MTTVAGRSLNELFNEYVFRTAVTFHGGACAHAHACLRDKLGAQAPLASAAQPFRAHAFVSEPSARTRSG